MEIDKHLWLRISTNDQDAYAEAYRYYYKRFYNYGRKFSDNEHIIEDVVQETLLTIWDRRTSLASIEYPSTYFYTSFRNKLFEKLKQHQRLVLADITIDEPEFSAEHFIVAREQEGKLKEHLQKAMATLTDRQREAIFLRFYEGLSYEQVADVMNITVKATYKIMARSLQQLREHLDLSPGLLVILLHQVFSSQDFF